MGLFSNEEILEGRIRKWIGEGYKQQAAADSMVKAMKESKKEHALKLKKAALRGAMYSMDNFHDAGFTEEENEYYMYLILIT